MGARAIGQWEEVLRARGLRAIRVDGVRACAQGIGGSGTILEVVLMPMGIGGRNGILEFLALEQDVPPRLPVGFLEILGPGSIWWLIISSSIGWISESTCPDILQDIVRFASTRLKTPLSGRLLRRCRRGLGSRLAASTLAVPPREPVEIPKL